MDEITVIKLNLERVETWRYSGHVLKRSPRSLLIEAAFNRDDILFQGVQLKCGDPFIEIYYSDRWYNIFEIHDRDSGEIKGWYCNVTRPAELGVSEIRFVDLALDLFVYPDGRQLVLDEDEFEQLQPDEELRTRAYAALEELKRVVRPLDGFRLS
jgi:protein associated with RNAse G/E